MLFSKCKTSGISLKKTRKKFRKLPRKKKRFSLKKDKLRRSHRKRLNLLTTLTKIKKRRSMKKKRWMMISKLNLNLTEESFS